MPSFIHLPESNSAVNVDLVVFVQFTGTPDEPTSTLFFQSSEKPQGFSTADTLALIKHLGLNETDVRKNAETPERVAQRLADEMRNFVG